MTRKRKPIKLPKNHREALDALRHMLEFRVRKRWPIPTEGLEFTVWLFPRGSKYGGGAACRPCERVETTITTTNNTASSSVPIKWYQTGEKGRGAPQA